MADLRILVIADDPLARAGLATLLAGQAGCTVVGRVSGSDDLTAAVGVHRPDVLLWDIGWNPVPALERLAQSVETALPVAVLLPDQAHIIQAWTAGARALLRRDADPAQIAAALAAIAQGLTVIAVDFAAGLSFQAGPREPKAWADPDAAPLVEELTPRELTVLRLVAEGLPNKTIALRLGISEHTVKFHINAILGKLGVASRTEAVVRATRLGLILL
jgi:two-component system nitrate/nitrite response regulator NarL